MRLSTKLFAGAVAAAALFAALTGSATAGKFSISNRNIRAVFSPLQITGFTTQTISCIISMEGSFHSGTISKVANALIGYLTRASVPGCEGGLIRVLQASLPWHIRYTGFYGTLPNVRVRIQLVNAGIEEPGTVGNCLYRISPFFMFEGPVAGSNINTGAAFIRFEEAELFEAMFCPPRRFGGRSLLTLLGTTTAITVRLI